MLIEKMIENAAFSSNAVEKCCSNFPRAPMTDKKMADLGSMLSCGVSNNPMRRRAYRTLSPLRLIWWGSLLLGVRGQRTDPYPAQFELSSLDGTNGLVIHGEQAGDESGFRASSAGDVNGDGFTDIVIGARYLSPTPSRKGAGRSYIVFGGSRLGSSGLLKLSSLNGTNGIILNGERANDQSGYAVSNAGDVNGDGINDLLIGAPNASPSAITGAGKAYVIFGNRTLGRSRALELSNLDGTNGFVLHGVNRDDNSGITVSSIGDVNADGIDDLLIGASFASPDTGYEAGIVYVVFGAVDVGGKGIIELRNLNGVNGFLLKGEKANDWNGRSLSNAGDVNDDGVNDFLIGARLADPTPDRPDAGKSYVVFGGKTLGNSGTFALSSLNGTNGYIINGEQNNDQSGKWVSGAGDVNGDGISDFLIGAPYADPNSTRSDAGKAYLVFGGLDLGRSGIFELSSLDGKNGLVLSGDQASDSCGFSVSSAGDVNRDGIADILVGAPFADPTSSRSDAGKTYVVFGNSNLGKKASLELSSLNDTTGFILRGEKKDDTIGTIVSNAGDVNGDGVADILLGAPFTSTGTGKDKAGKTYIIFGRDLTRNSAQAPSQVTQGSDPENPRQSITSLQPTVESSMSHYPLTGDVIDTSYDKTPPYGGIAVGVTAFVCSLLAGVLFYYKRVLTPDTPQQETPLDQEQGAVTHHDYGLIQPVAAYDKPPPPATDYGQVSPEETDNQNYQSVNELMKPQQNEYESPDSPL